MKRKSNLRHFTLPKPAVIFTPKILKLIFVLLLSGCRASHLDPKALSAKQPSVNPNPLDVASVDFSYIKKNIFNRCTTCHDQYKTYRGVVREITAINSTISLNRMPKSGGPLSPDQKDLLNRWIQNGAPEFSNQTAQPIQIPPLVAEWKSIYDGVIAPKCLVCHNPRGQAKFLDFSSRESIYSQRNRKFGGLKLIDFENIDESYIVQILSDVEEPMPPIWSNIPLLSEDEKRIFSQWLALDLP